MTILKETNFSGRTRGAVPLRLAILIAVLLGAIVIFILFHSDRSAPNNLPAKPSAGRLLADTASIFKYEAESVQSTLESMRNRYGIEMMVVTLPSLNHLGTIEEAAAKIMTAWKVGENFSNRGILGLYAVAEGEVKLEVSYELEDIFTNLFVGEAEALQLKPYFRQGEPGTGLTAVLEELEIRASLKKDGQFSPRTIARLDAQFASGGAGAAYRLKREIRSGIGNAGGPGLFAISSGPSIFPDSALLSGNMPKSPKYQPGRTPAEAYEIMKAAFRARGDSRDIAFFDKQEGKPYEILQNENRAVIFFGENNEEAYQPFLFAKTEDGWVFDFVNQNRYVRYGPGGRWALGEGDHEYQGLFDQRRYYWLMADDIPWSADDVYRPEDDRRIVARIIELEGFGQKKPDDFETALELGRLGTMINRRLNLVIPCLQRAKTLNPRSPLPYQYAAIAYVNNGNQYQKAIPELKELLSRDSDSPFGRELLGYVYYRLKDYDSATEQLRKALQTAPADCYAAVYLGYALAERYKAKGSPRDKEAALQALRVGMVDACGPSKQRAWMLLTSFERGGLLTPVFFGASWYWYHDQNNQGVVVYDVQAGTPADRAGLQAGDFILSFNGQPVHQSWELIYLIAVCQPGQRVQVEIVRGALEGPLALGDGITVNPKTSGLNPPERLILDVTLERKESRS